MVEYLIPKIMISIIILAILFFAILVSFPFKSWFAALSNGLKISFFDLLAMKIRKIDPNVIIENAIKLKKENIIINPIDLESHYLAGGNLYKVTNALISAKKAGLKIDFKYVTALDLSSNDPEEAILEYQQPKELKKNNLSFLSKNGEKYEVSFKTLVRRSIEKPCSLSLSLSVVVEYIKNQIEDEIYNTDSEAIDINSLTNKIINNSVKETSIDIIDLKIFIKRL